MGQNAVNLVATLHPAYWNTFWKIHPCFLAHSQEKRAEAQLQQTSSATHQESL